MTSYLLGIKPAVAPFSHHDPSAALFKDGNLVFGVEEERFTRQKHAVGAFPTNAVEACLEFEDISLADVEKIVVPQESNLIKKRLSYDLKSGLRDGDTTAQKTRAVLRNLKQHYEARLSTDKNVRQHLNEIAPGQDLPAIEHRSHHLLHAVSAFYPTNFDNGIILTIDGSGEHDSTVVWRGTPNGLERIRTYEIPNSFGFLYGVVTEYLGYRANNGEGKVMGLAPYGEPNSDIEERFRDVMDFGIDYDVTELTAPGPEESVRKLESLLEHPRNTEKGEFTQFYKDVAYTMQSLLEESIVEIVETYVESEGVHNVGLAGGVALNCKMNKRVMELDCVDDVFIQPVANDAGLSLGAGWSESSPQEVDVMDNAYLGPEISRRTAKQTLQQNKIDFEQRDDVEEFVAQKLSNGSLVGWVQGRMEMGPRALGNRSILADPRTVESRDRVNKFVKHREQWRPFAPSMKADAAETYLKNSTVSPFMIKTFETKERTRGEIQAVVHQADKTTRPQTVTKHQNPRYHSLLSEFEDLTGVPVLLNTSFNDHGEPIVRDTADAIRDFYSMGLDLLVIDDLVVEK